MLLFMGLVRAEANPKGTKIAVIERGYLANFPSESSNSLVIDSHQPKEKIFRFMGNATFSWL
ncbi:MAG: hypothetical protein ACOH5I_23430 [Oligoflexus sp.]